VRVDVARHQVSPIDFARERDRLRALSANLSALPANGRTEIQWGGMQFIGDGISAVQVFNVNGADLASVNWSSFSGIAPGQTVIVNVNGDGGFTGGTSNGFANFNTLYNFYNANTISINTGVYGSILAPHATVQGGGGRIDGNVVVKNWDSSIQINAVNHFKASSLEGRPVAATQAPVASKLSPMPSLQASVVANSDSIDTDSVNDGQQAVNASASLGVSRSAKSATVVAASAPHDLSKKLHAQKDCNWVVINQGKPRAVAPRAKIDWAQSAQELCAPVPNGWLPHHRLNAEHNEKSLAEITGLVFKKTE